MRARTLGQISARSLGCQNGQHKLPTALAQYLPWLVHIPPQLSVSCFCSPLGELKVQQEGTVGALASPSIAPHPHHSRCSSAGRQSSRLTCLHPSISGLPAFSWHLFQGHHPFYSWVLSPAPFSSNPQTHDCSPRPGCASSLNRLGTSRRPAPILYSSILFLPVSKDQTHSSSPPILELSGPVWWRNSACCNPLLNLDGGGAPRLPAPSPPEVSLPLLVKGLLAIPHPHTSPWSLSSQPSRSGAQLTQRREGQGGRGKEVVGGSRVGTASGRDGHGLPWQPQAARQLGGQQGGGSGGVQIGNCTQERLFHYPLSQPVLSFLENIQAHTCPFS